MAYTVQAAFDEFYNNINLGGDHRETANIRHSDIVNTLKSKFEIIESFGSGSIPRFTALKNHADIDIMVALHYGKHIKDKTPAEVLQSIRDALGEYRNNVRKNGQAVTLYYKTWPNVDIVPVAKVMNGDQLSHYEVPDMNKGTWINSNPKTHSSNIDARASACGASFRKIIKMLKWWNLSHSGYLQSYHIEAMAFNGMTSNLSDLPWDVFQFFSKCHELTAGSLWYELGFADAYLSASDRTEARKRLAIATDKARDAWWHGCEGRPQTAIAGWRQIFGDKFPNYG